MISVPQLPKSTYDPRANSAMCDRCPLSAKGIPVPPEAPRSGRVRLVIVGEQPGRTETKTGRPFQGVSGKLLDQILGESKFSRADAFITNAAMCLNPDDRDEEAAAKANVCCAPRLARELSSLPKEVPILTLGKSAAKSVLGVRTILGKNAPRGFIWEAPEVSEGRLKSARRLIKKYARAPVKKAKAEDTLIALEARVPLAGRTVIPTIHPAFVLRSDFWRPLLAIDIDRAVRVSRGQAPLQDTGPHVVVGTASALKKALRGFSNIVNVDIETDSAKPTTCNITCIGFCDVENVDRNVVAWPWKKSMIPVVRAFLKNRTVVTHNGPAFDEIALRRFGITWAKGEDTLIAHHAILSHFPQSLAHVVSTFLDSRPWKLIHRGKGDEKGQSMFAADNEDLAAYSHSDVRLGALVWRAMQSDLEPERAVYEHDMKIAAVCRDLQIVGIHLNQEKKEALAKKLKFRAAALLGELRKLTGKKDFNPNAPDHIRKALFGRFHAPVLAVTPTGLRSTAVGTLEAIRGKDTNAGLLSDYILRYRFAKKMKSTYLDSIVPDADGRVHANWKSFGTVSGRYSCRLMTLPHDEDDVSIRSIFDPEAGKVFTYYDVRQAEMKLAAWTSGDEKFIAEVNTKDPYLARAKQIFPESISLFESDPESLSEPEKKLRKDLRQLAKMASLAANYLITPDSLFAKLRAAGMNVTLMQVEAVLRKIHREYRGYFKYVEDNVRLCQKQGYLRSSILGRIRWLGFYAPPTEVSNYKIQSGIADVMNMRLIEMLPKLPEGAHLVAQIHDACIFEVPTAKVEEVQGLIKRTWAEEVVLPESGRRFELTIDMKTAGSWGELG